LDQYFDVEVAKKADICQQVVIVRTWKWPINTRLSLMTLTSVVRGTNEPVNKFWEKWSSPEMPPEMRKTSNIHNGFFTLSQLTTVEEIFESEEGVAN